METDCNNMTDTKIISKISERVILNVGGTRFETYKSTFSQYPSSLLGAMFSERNTELRKPDSKGEYFFDRSPVVFEAIINFYRTGKMMRLPGVSKEMLEEEIEFWQLPDVEVILQTEKLGNKLATTALEVLRKKVHAILEKIKLLILERIEIAANEGVQSFSIEFKESQQQEYYAFLSNFSHRELLLHDLLYENFDVSFNDITSGQGHSYILFITLWNRFTRQRVSDTTTGVARILEELRAGVEIKTAKDDHIISVAQYKS